MHTLKLAAALIAAHVALGTVLAAAAEPAFSELFHRGRVRSRPAEQFKSEAELRAQVEKLSYQVVRVRVDAGCYEVLAADRNGTTLRGEVSRRRSEDGPPLRSQGRTSMNALRCLPTGTGLDAPVLATGVTVLLLASRLPCMHRCRWTI